MTIIKVTVRGQYIDEQECYCVRGKELDAIHQMVNDEDYPYFVKAFESDQGYFRGETPELPEKVRAYVQLEVIEVLD